ncbi:roadblock/LC7 domain-containing protein, partial [Nocardia seriolae]
MNTSHAGDLDWLLDDLVDRLAGVRHAVVHSTDGLLLGRSAGMSREDAEHFCAMSSTLFGLSRSAGHRFDAGGVCQAVIELERAVLILQRHSCSGEWVAAASVMGESGLVLSASSESGPGPDMVGPV